MAGYSGTPLPRKLGIRPGQRLHFAGAPSSFRADLGALPGGALLLDAPAPPVDLAVVFAGDRDTLRSRLDAIEPLLAPDGALWAAWPKKASGVPTDLVEDRVREVGLGAGLVDVKVCAIDQTWSGLKFVYRKEDRAAVRARRELP